MADRDRLDQSPSPGTPGARPGAHARGRPRRAPALGPKSRGILRGRVWVADEGHANAEAIALFEGEDGTPVEDLLR